MKKVVLIIILILIIFIPLSYFLFFNNHIEVLLNGENNIKLDVGANYIDKGIILKNNNKIISQDEYKLNKIDNLDINKLGTYEINYNITYKGKEYNLTRNISVIDTTYPNITVNTDEIEKDSCTNKITTKLEYTAMDNYDGDITKNVETIEEDNTLILKVKDSSNNTVTKKLKINYSSMPQSKFTLVGNSRIYVPLNGTYKEYGTKYIDGCGNTIDKDILITGDVNTNKLGEYKKTYKVDEKTLTRTIIVYEPSNNPIPNNKVIYLTFDDGPGYYTNKILNTLDKYNVKATFFVTHQFPSYISLIKTEYEKGHSIGVHTYTHNYDVYTSLETYLNDFNKMNEVVKEYTGSYTNLFRFPGGSSNTISKSYKKGVVTEIANRMTEDGYVYFDWNVSSGDAEGYGSNKIYNNVVSGIKSCSKCVVLMHDIKSTTANALDDILHTLTSKGYEFRALNENSPTTHHGINN